MDDVKRIWATVPAADAAALELVAVARGLRSSDLLREAVSAMIGAPAQGGDASLALVLARLDQAAARLEALTATAESHTMSTRIALDLAYGAETQRDMIHHALTDIAMAIGVVAGSIEPMDSGGPF